MLTHSTEVELFRHTSSISFSAVVVVSSRSLLLAFGLPLLRPHCCPRRRAPLELSLHFS